MSLATIAGHEVHVDDEGFMTEYDEWDERLAEQLAGNIGIDLTSVISRRSVSSGRTIVAVGETPTLRRVTTLVGSPQELFTLP